MLLNELKEKLQTIKKGVFVKMQWMSKPATLAKYKDVKIKKYSKGVVRIGIKYANLKANKEKNTGPLLWGKFSENFDNYIIEHTKEGKTRYYLRVYVSLNPKHKTIVQWFMDGIETTKEYLQNKKIISNSTKKPTLCFDVPVENIISLG